MAKHLDRNRAKAPEIDRSLSVKAIFELAYKINVTADTFTETIDIFEEKSL